MVNLHPVLEAWVVVERWIVTANGQAAMARSRRPLRDAVLVIGPGWQCRLAHGEYLIGRDATCRLCIPDPLASREHARLCIRAEGVTVVDLGSANGVFVNTVRVTEPRRLFDGDHVLVGSTDLAVYGEASASEDDRPTLTGTESPPGETVRATALGVLGRVAERFLAAHEPAQARRVLADQLVRVLGATRSGQHVSKELCLEASRYALLLAGALRDGAWVDYTIELHLRGEIGMAPATLDELETALAQAPRVDRNLYRHYVTWLESGPAKGAGLARLVAERLRGLKLP